MNKKQIYDLTEDDFSKWPIWEFAGENESDDECTVVGRSAGYSCDSIFLVKAIFKLGNDMERGGYISPSVTDHLGYIQPSIYINGRSLQLWFGMTLPDPGWVYNNYNISADELFPVEYKSIIDFDGLICGGKCCGFGYIEGDKTIYVK